MSDRKVVAISNKLHRKIEIYCMLNNKKIKDFVNDVLEKKMENVKFKSIKV